MVTSCPAREHEAMHTGSKLTERRREAPPGKELPPGEQAIKGTCMLCEQATIGICHSASYSILLHATRPTIMNQSLHFKASGCQYKATSPPKPPISSRYCHFSPVSGNRRNTRMNRPSQGAWIRCSLNRRSTDGRATDVNATRT